MGPSTRPHSCRVQHPEGHLAGTDPRLPITQECYDDHQQACDAPHREQDGLPPGDSDLHCTISSWTSCFLDHHPTCVQGHLSCTNACPWSLFDHHRTCVQGHLGCTSACSWSLRNYHPTCVQGHLGCTSAGPWSPRNYHLACVQGHLGCTSACPWSLQPHQQQTHKHTHQPHQ